MDPFFCTEEAAQKKKKKNPMSIFPALKILARMLHLDLIRENEFIGPKDVLIGVFIVLLICIPFNVDID